VSPQEMLLDKHISAQMFCDKGTILRLFGQSDAEARVVTPQRRWEAWRSSFRG